MAPIKRKRETSSSETPRKKIKRIVQENTQGGTTKYLVEWAGFNPLTVKPWNRTWRSVKQVTDAAIADWEEVKAAREAHLAQPQDAYTQPQQAEDLAQHQSTAKNSLRKTRARRVVDSSSSSQAVPSHPARNQRPLRRSTRKSSQSSGQTPSASPYVEVTPRNQSSLESYQYISQVGPSPSSRSGGASPPSSGRTSASAASSTQSRATSFSFRSTGVVLDSEDEDGDGDGDEDVTSGGLECSHPSGSYIPTTTTQSTGYLTSSQPQLPSALTQSQHPSTFSHEGTAIYSSPEEPPSPSPSIAETEPEVEPSISLDDEAGQNIVEESIPESQSAPQSHAESQREIPDTFEETTTLSTVEDPPTRRVGPFDEVSHSSVAHPSTQEALQNAPQSTPKEPEQGGTQSSIQEEPRSVPQSTAVEPPTEGEGSTQERRDESSRSISSRPAEQENNDGESEEQTTLLESVPEPVLQTEASAEERSARLNELSATLSAESRGTDSPVHPQNQIPFNGSISPHGAASAAADTIQVPFTQQQHAQVQPFNSTLSTQDPHSSTSSRTRVQNSSPAPRPPRHSLETLDTATNAPPRLKTPTSSSSTAFMSSNEPDKVPTPSWGERAIESARAKAALEAAESMKMRNLADARKMEERAARARERLENSQRVQVLGQQMESETGTRSPSTIPSQPPVPLGPTSLRTVASPVPAVGPSGLQNEVDNSGSDSNVAEVEPEPQPEPEPEPEPAAAPAPVPVLGPTTTEDVDMDEDPFSDADEDDSLLVDELELQAREFIVPLPMRGRQADTYRRHSKALKELLSSSTPDPQANEHKIQDVFRKLRCIETHIDLIWYGNQSSHPGDDQAIQDKHFVQWSHDNSVKFLFISTLLNQLKEQDLHVILLIEQEDHVHLFNIMESFLRGNDFSFDSPITGQAHKVRDVQGKGDKLKITLLASTSPRIVRETNLIICLDGKPDVTEIRKRPWAIKSDRSGVPLLQLVIPRTIGHVDRFLSPRLSSKRATHTIIGALSQFTNQGTIGRAVEFDTPDSSEAAEKVVRFFFPSEDDPVPSEWPLPEIGSVKDIIEYQSQQSVDVLDPEPLPGSKAAGKRPLLDIDERADDTKRMRLTPQAQLQTHGENNRAMSLEQERDYWKQDARRLREVERDWANRQTLYEDTRKANSVLRKEKEEIEKKLAASEIRESRLREQLNAKNITNSELRTQLEEQKKVNFLSEDERVVEFTRLKDDLAKKTEAEQKALKLKDIAESTLGFAQERFRDAQTQVIETSAQLDEANEKIAKLERAAKSPELLRQHQDRQDRRSASKEDRLSTENTNLKRQLKVKIQENDKLKTEMERMKMTRGVGGGTRAASVGARTPRPGSRAASPLPNGRDRVANLRQG